MIIKKFQGNTQTEATDKAKAELGESAVIMNTKEIKPTGLFKFFKKTTYEVTAAIEEHEPTPPADKKADSGKPPLSGSGAYDYATLLANVAKNVKAQSAKEETDDAKTDNGANLEERLDNLQQLIEKQFKPEEKEAEEKVEDEEKKEQPVIEMIRLKLLENEVDEKYVNQILGEVEKVAQSNASIDYVLSNVYKKMILLFGQPTGIELGGKKPKVVFFVGPTGVGKTTTIAKIASHYKVEQGKKLALLTSDTYRIAAAEQLRIYANILDVPLKIIYTPDEMAHAVDSMEDYEIILVDTSGFSHKNQEQRDSMKALLDSIGDDYNKEIFLVVSATTKYKDLIEIADVYSNLSRYKIIFTKLDETSAYGNILNIRMYTKAEMSYITNGQVVPDDIEVFDAQKIVKQLLGGK